jgi:hypothetical protein
MRRAQLLHDHCNRRICRPLENSIVRKLEFMRPPLIEAKKLASENLSIILCWFAAVGIWSLSYCALSCIRWHGVPCGFSDFRFKNGKGPTLTIQQRAP